MKKYATISNQIESQIHRGLYSSADKLPSIRVLSDQYSVSKNTILSALDLLQNKGLIYSVEKAGFFVTRTSTTSKLRKHSWERVNLGERSHLVQLFERLVEKGEVADYFTSQPTPSLSSIQLIEKCLRSLEDLGLEYSSAQGDMQLRQILSQYFFSDLPFLDPEKIVITNGASEAIYLTLRANLKPGDRVAVELPTYFGYFEILESLGLQCIEIPRNPEGICVETLDMAVRKDGIRAVILQTRFNNPTTLSYTPTRLLELVDYLEQQDLLVIEDDVYGGFAPDRKPLGYYAQEISNYVYINSISKVFAAGLRLGWVASARRIESISKAKHNVSHSTSNLSQKLLIEVFKKKSYSCLLKEAQSRYVENNQKYIRTLSESDTILNIFSGSYLLWIELEKGCCSDWIFKKLLELNIAVAPGSLFSESKKFANFIRFNAARPYNPEIEKTLLTINEVLESSRPS